jgi:hypothetical protein
MEMRVHREVGRWLTVAGLLLMMAVGQPPALMVESTGGAEQTKAAKSMPVL